MHFTMNPGAVLPERQGTPSEEGGRDRTAKSGPDTRATPTIHKSKHNEPNKCFPIDRLG